MLYVNDLNDPHHCVFVFKYVNGIIDFKFNTKRISDIYYNNRGKSSFAYRDLDAVMENNAFYIKD